MLRYLSFIAAAMAIMSHGPSTTRGQGKGGKPLTPLVKPLPLPTIKSPIISNPNTQPKTLVPPTTNVPPKGANFPLNPVPVNAPTTALKIGKFNNGNIPFKQIIPGVNIVLAPVLVPAGNPGVPVAPVDPVPAPVEPAQESPVAPAAPPKPATPLDPVGVVPVQQQNKEYGLRITEIDPGPAEKAGLKVGDVILAVGDYRTQSFEDLRQVVQASNGPFVVTYWSNAGNKLQTVTVTPVEKRIGVSVVAIEIE